MLSAEIITVILRPLNKGLRRKLTRGLETLPTVFVVLYSIAAFIVCLSAKG